MRNKPTKVKFTTPEVKGVYTDKGKEVEYVIEEEKDITNEVTDAHSRLMALHSKGTKHTNDTIATQSITSIPSDLIEEWILASNMILDIRPTGDEVKRDDEGEGEPVPGAPAQNEYEIRLNQIYFNGKRRAYQSYGGFLEEQDNVWNPIAWGHGYPNYDGTDVSKGNTETSLSMFMLNHIESLTYTGTAGHVTKGIPVEGTIRIDTQPTATAGHRTVYGVPIRNRSGYHYTTSNSALAQRRNVPLTPDIPVGHMQVTDKNERGSFKVQIDGNSPVNSHTWSDVAGRGMLNTFAEALTPHGQEYDYYVYYGGNYRGHEVWSVGNSESAFWQSEHSINRGTFFWRWNDTLYYHEPYARCILNPFTKSYYIESNAFNRIFGDIPTCSLTARAQKLACNSRDYADYNACNPQGPNSSRTPCERNFCETPSVFAGATRQGGPLTDWVVAPFLTGYTWREIREGGLHRQNLMTWVLEGIINRTGLFDVALRGMESMDVEGLNAMFRVDKHRLVVAQTMNWSLATGYSVATDDLHDDPYWSTKRWNWKKDW